MGNSFEISQYEASTWSRALESITWTTLWSWNDIQLRFACILIGTPARHFFLSLANSLLLTASSVQFTIYSGMSVCYKIRSRLRPRAEKNCASDFNASIFLPHWPFQDLILYFPAPKSMVDGAVTATRERWLLQIKVGLLVAPPFYPAANLACKSQEMLYNNASQRYFLDVHQFNLAVHCALPNEWVVRRHPRRKSSHWTEEVVD